jgi:predicted short-subunit dehydrogenase-like oxidoreductase (DUF2520 family)
MLPGMPATVLTSPRIAIVGAGNLASALAVSLHAAGYGIEQILSRADPASLRRARKLAHDVETSAAAIGRAQISSDVVWFCVPDGAIAAAASSLANAADWKGKVALHSSGALTSDELAPLRELGASVASVHPLMTFVCGSRPLLSGVPFAIEGNPKAARTARSIVRHLQGDPFTVLKAHKVAYHAWGMFASPLLTALLAATERVAEAAGISRKAAKERMLPILEQTLTNYAWLGAPGSFSGPIARGDAATVEKHLKVLQEVPGAQEIYLALARAALRDLPSKNRAALEKTLKSLSS